MWSMKLTPRHNITDLMQQKSIRDIAFHSGSVLPGSIFFVTDYIEKYLLQALERGAKYIVSKEPLPNLPSSVENIIVDNVRIALGEAAAFLYPLKPKYIVAVTGTNGKSSVVDYYRQICFELGLKAASIGTMGILCNDSDVQKMLDENFTNDLTTPDVISMHKILSALAERGVEHLAFEASSHGIDQMRIGSINVKVAIFTNFSQDHLDYHHTMEGYLSAKLRLFSENLDPSGVAIIESKLYPDIKEYLAKHKIAGLTVGKDGDCKILKTNADLSGQTIEFEYSGRKYSSHFDIVGSFQSDNVLMTVMALAHSDIKMDAIVKALAALKAVAGRLERVTPADYPYHVFVDYAHKPHALESTLLELKSLCKGRLIALFGCGGDRDSSKRKIMGEIAARIADIVIVTDDNPRTEDAASIRKQIMEGAKGASEIGSRRDAIELGIKQMQPNDILLIAGKGHEDYQIIGKKKMHFSDREEVLRCIK